MLKDGENISSRKLIDRLTADPRWGPMRGLLATTYELTPDFLETDFLPSVFGLGAWDDRSWTTRIALEKRLFELETAVVFTEARRYRGRPRSLRLELRPVASPRGTAFHAKVTLLLYERAVRLIVGSANLTEQGYRRNREAIAVLTATQASPKDAGIIAQALTGAASALAPWLSSSARSLITRSIETLHSWGISTPDPYSSFVWTHGSSRLWQEFLQRWPQNESVQRLFILSPFWSEDAGLTLSRFVAELKSVGALSRGAEVRLLTDAFQEANGKFIPVLPPSYASLDWSALGVTAIAQAVSPKVHPDELGGMEGFTGMRALHAKVVLMESSKSSLAYVGSANFTAHGWGFLRGTAAANVEAGLILRHSRQSAAAERLLPDTIGDPVLLTGTNVKALRGLESGPDDDPWPGFIRQILLTPTSEDEDRLELVIDVEPATVPLRWSATLAGKEQGSGERAVLFDGAVEPPTSSVTIPLPPQTLTRLLTEQEVLICWPECPSGRLVPINVSNAARGCLPISPGAPRIREADLLSYYQGRIAWEQLFPDADAAPGEGNGKPTPADAGAGVDKSRIQSYQIREFVEALAGLRRDLQAATQSEPAMRLALLGPVSPYALAQAVVDAVKSTGRSPTAAAFQLVEILAILKAARFFAVPERLTDAWRKHLDQTTKSTSRLLEQLIGEHSDMLATNGSFARYRKVVLTSEPGSNG